VPSILSEGLANPDPHRIGHALPARAHATFERTSDQRQFPPRRRVSNPLARSARVESIAVGSGTAVMLLLATRKPMKAFSSAGTPVLERLDARMPFSPSFQAPPRRPRELPEITASFHSRTLPP
jgi:hypothetical protein